MNKISFGVRVPNSGPLSSIQNIVQATKAAEEVGMYRQNLQQKMRELGITIEEAGKAARERD